MPSSTGTERSMLLIVGGGENDKLKIPRLRNTAALGRNGGGPPLDLILTTDRERIQCYCQE